MTLEGRRGIAPLLSFLMYFLREVLLTMLRIPRNMDIIMPPHTPEAVEKTILKDINEDMKSFGPALISSKIEQQKVLAESVAQGGPSTLQDALKLLLAYGKIGDRALAREVNQPRKRLTRMLAGEITMPADVYNNVVDAIERMRPGMIDRLEKSLENDDIA